MIVCKKCKGTNIKSRTNFPYGKKSKSITSFRCKDCGSPDVENNSKNFGRKNNSKRRR